ncbi:MAG TPA: hypothetical protein VGR37_22435, partial [Longimicrobiaceae bacterium]|nr:hypothetical protein [Longimicrobiaceae bacterium]
DLLRLRIASCRARAAAAPSPVAFDRPHLAAARRTLHEHAPLTLGDLAIGGADLRALGLPPGPLYGEVLRDLLERVTDDPSLNDREALLDLVRHRVA